MLTVLFYIFIIISIIDVLHFGFFLVGANYYDIWQFRRNKRLANAPRSHRRLPFVSVLVPAHNEELGIVRCLESIMASKYRKFEIIVIDDASSDITKRLVQHYMIDHPYQAISLLYKRKNSGKANALNHALQRQARGDLIMTLDADSMLHPDTIGNAVSYFEDPTIAGVAANVRIMDSLSVLGLLQKFEHMVGYRSKKFFSVINGEFIVGGVASTYRREVLHEVKFYDNDTATEDIGLSLKVTALGNRQHRIIYAANVLAMTEGVQSFKALLRQRYRWKLGSLQNLLKHRDMLWGDKRLYTRTLTWYRLPMAFIGEFMLLLEPLVIGYVIFLSFALLNAAMIVGAYLTITLYLLLNVWPDEHMDFNKKVRMSLYAPAMYFIFYLMNFVQLSAIIRCLFNHKQVRLKLNLGSSTWVSPKRQGVQQVQFS